MLEDSGVTGIRTCAYLWVYEHQNTKADTYTYMCRYMHSYIQRFDRLDG